MGLFGKILSGLEIVGGAVMMFVPGMQLAGAMMITAGLASSGIVGGSVGKFLNSGWGQGLMAAVSLGSTAYAMYGNSLVVDSAGMSAQAEQGATEAAVSSSNEASAQVTADLAAGTGGSDQLATGASISGASNINTSSFVSAASASAGGSTPQALGQASSVIDPLNPQANLAMTQSNQQVASAGNTLEQGGANSAVNPGAGTTPSGGSMTPSPNMNPSAPVTSGAEGSAPTGAGGAGGGGGAGGAGAAPAASSAPGDMLDGAGAGSSPGGAASAAAAGGAPADSSGGFLSKAMSFADKHPGIVEAGGKMLGGIGAGMEQKSAMEDQIRAQQWAGRTYMDPQAQAQLKSAVSQPITVPSGYMQRAQALRNMLNNSAITGPGTAPAPAAYRG